MNSRDDWLKKRKLGIGGSDAAAILGYSPWKSPMDVWMDKLGLNPPSGGGDPHRQFLLDLGVELEPVIARLYEKATSERVYQPVIVPVTHPKYEILIGTPDRLVLGQTLGVELKSESDYADEFGDPGTDEVPYNYLIQCAHYMAVMEYSHWDVALLKSGSTFAIYHLQRDMELENEIIDNLRAWWNDHIVKKIPPDLDGSDAWKRYIKQKFPMDTLPVVKVTDEKALMEISKLRVIRQIVEETGALQAKSENEIKELIGDHSGLIGEFGRVTWKKTKDARHVDWESVAHELRAVNINLFDLAVKNHTTMKPGTRRFLFSPRKDWVFHGTGAETRSITAAAESIRNARDRLYRLGSSSEGVDRGEIRNGRKASS